MSLYTLGTTKRHGHKVFKRSLDSVQFDFLEDVADIVRKTGVDLGILWSHGLC